MRDRDRKILLVILIISILLSLSAIFLPIFGINYADILEKNGYERPKIYWKTESSFIFRHFSIYDFREDRDNSEFHRYWMFGQKFDFGNTTLINEFTNPSYEEKIMNDVDNPRAYSASALLYAIAGIVSLIIFIYFSYKVYKNLDNKKNRYFLYLGFLIFIGLFLRYIYDYYGQRFSDVNNLGYAESIYLTYGFYTMLFSGILFIILYYLKNYFIKNLNKPDAE